MKSLTVWHGHSTRPSLPAGTARKASGHLSGQRPLHLANARPFGRLKAPLGLSLLRCAAQTRACLWQAEQAHHTTSKEKQSVPDEERPVVHIAVVCSFWQGASGWAHPVFLLCFIIFHAQHPVSYTNMSLDQMRRIRVSFQFFAQGRHINTQRGNVIFLRTAPYFLREGGMRQHFAHIMRQHTQQFVLDGGQMQFILAQPDSACREIDL